MKKHVFLTGEIQIGKTTVIRRFLENTGIHADGFVTRFNTREKQRELYISRFDSEKGESDSRLAVKMNWPETEVFIDAFSYYGAEIIKSSGRYGLIIMDELGVFEERSPEFKEAVFEKLSGDKQILGVVKIKKSPFLDEVREHPNVVVYEITEENRDFVPAMLEGLICGD